MSHRIWLIAVLLALAFSPAAFSATSKTTVLVIAFENQTGDRNIEWIGEGLAALLVERLNAEPSLYVFGRDERVAQLARLNIPETILLSRATILKIAWDIGADVAVYGSFSGTNDALTIEAQLLNVTEASLGRRIRTQGKLDELMTLGATISSGVAKALAPDSTVPESDFISRPPIPRSAFEAYIRGLLVPDPLRTIEFYSDAIRLNPQYGSALYQLGRMHSSNTDYRLSASLLERVPPVAMEFPHARFLLGLDYYRLGEYEKAADTFAGLPPVYDVLVNLGAAQARNGEVVLALSTWMAAAQRDPHGSEAAFNVAWLQLSAGVWDLARKGFEEFLQLHGRDAEALFGLATALEKLGLADQAQRTAAQAVRLSPRIERLLHQPLPDLLRLRTEFDLTQVRLGENDSIWNPARLRRRAGGQDLSAWLDEVGSHVDGRPYGEILRELEDIARTFPESPEVPLVIGSVYERRGQFDRAALSYLQSLQLKASVDGYLMLARLYRSRNQMPEALLAVQDALRLEPGNAAALSLRAEIERSSVLLPGR